MNCVKFMKGVSSLSEIKFLKGGYTMNGSKPLTKLKLSDLWKVVKVTEEEIWGDLQEETKLMVKKILESSMEEEIMEYIGISRKYERSGKRQSQRNGYYERDLETELGKIEKLSVPRSRDGGFKTKVFKRYERKRPLVKEAIREMFLAGVSTRRVKDVLEPLIGSTPSAQTVSNVVSGLDGYVRSYHSRKIEDRHKYLFFDGIVVRVKRAVGKNKVVILCAFSIREDGVKELIDFMMVEKEDEKGWTKFLNNLYERGLEGKNLELITIDGNLGLRRAVDMVYPYTPVQRCWVHKLRNVASKVPKKLQEVCLRGAKRIYSAENKREAIERFWEWADEWRDVVPKAVECIEKDLEELLQFYDFPKLHWKKIRTTNSIERAFVEIRRRIRSISCFENRKSCERIIYALFQYNNKRWEEKPLHEFTQKT